MEPRSRSLLVFSELYSTPSLFFCICVFVYLCFCMRVFVYLCVCMRVFVYLCVCMRVFLYLRVCIYVYSGLSEFVHMVRISFFFCYFFFYLYWKFRCMQRHEKTLLIKL